MKLYNCIAIGLLLMSSSFSLSAQNQFGLKEKQVFLQLGNNKSFYFPNYLELQGPGYNFSTQSFKANDKSDEERTFRTAIRRYNIKTGYYYNKSSFIALGLDRSTFNIIPNQTVGISGYVSPSSGFMNNAEFTLTERYLESKYISEINNLFLELGSNKEIYDKKVKATFCWGAGLGLIYQRRNPGDSLVKLDKIQTAGLRFHVPLSVNVFFPQNFYISTETRGGYMLYDEVFNLNDGFKSIQEGPYLQLGISLGVLLDTRKKIRKEEGINLDGG